MLIALMLAAIAVLLASTLLALVAAIVVWAAQTVLAVLVGLIRAGNWMVRMLQHHMSIRVVP